MAAVRCRPIERQLETYEEEWKRDHDAAMFCLEFEEILALGIGIYSAIEQVYASWQASVSRGEEEFRTEDEQAMKGLFLRWLDLCYHAERQLADYEGQFGVVDFARDFRQTGLRAKGVLANWKPPVRQQAPGLLALTLTEEEAARLEEIQSTGRARLRKRPRAL
jgi:hypothetical protein